MADLGPAFIGLGGAALGSAGPVLLACPTRRDTRTLAVAARQEERSRVKRELTAGGIAVGSPLDYLRQALART